MSEITRKNGAYWDALAPSRHGEPVEFFKNGGCAVSPEELEVMGGNVVGKRILHVAASVGDEAVSLALLGAKTTAVDIAASHVETGRGKAAALGVDVDFRVCDMTALPRDLRGFDIIYVSWGGLCWVPDIEPWFADMADRLAVGGRLVVAEHHPLWEVLSVAKSDSLSVTASYFDQDWSGPRDIDKEPHVVKSLGLATKPHTSYVWNIGTVVTSMLRAGLTLTALQEFGTDSMYPGLSHGHHLPSTYVAAAVRR